MGQAVLQVQSDRLFAAVHLGAERGFILYERADVTVIIALRWFQLDNLSPEIGQKHCAKRPRHDAGQIHNAQSGQGFHLRGFITARAEQ